MKKSKSELENVKKFVDSSYNRYGNLVLVNDFNNYNPDNPLGYCYKSEDKDSGRVTYNIVCSKIGIARTDFRVLIHEYGHIYLGHLDGIHEELDTQICNIIRDNRAELIESINNSCGIDFGEKLIERVIDDPEMNHALHNIAMDMEVNSDVLSKDDIEEMEMDITSILPKTEEDLLRYLSENSINPEEKEKYREELDKMSKEAKVKLIIPERFNLGKDENGELIPFPNDRTYVEYLILMFKHLDQFIKMLVSIEMGKNGDTSEITKQMVQDMLQKMANQSQSQNQQNQSEEFKKGYQQALEDIRNGRVGQNSSQQSQQGQQNQSDSSQQGQQNMPNQSQGGQSGDESQSMSDLSGEEGDQCQQSRGQNHQNQSRPSQESSHGPQSQGQGGSGSPSDQMSDFEKGYQQAIQDALSQNQNQGMDGFSQLLQNVGLSDPGQKKGEGREQNKAGSSSHSGKGSRAGTGSQDSKKMDHGNSSRDEADKKRAAGQIVSQGGTGCGKSGGSEGTREVDVMADDVDMALREVLSSVKSRVVKYNSTIDLLKLWNRGINRQVIAPSVSRRIDLVAEPRLVFLIDISGSMDTRLVDRILKTISKSLHHLQRGLKYDIITWNTRLGEHLRDIDTRKPVPRISYGGGTDMALGMEYFRNNYDKNAILVLISDFEDDLPEWHKVESKMKGYLMYGFNYGRTSYTQEWKYFKQRDFSDYGYD